MLQIHNLTTGTAHPLSDSAPLTANDILLYPNESPDELSQLQNSWAQIYPALTHLLLTLLHQLIRADWNHRRALALLQQLQLDLHLTGLPITHWDAFTLQHLHFFQRHAARTQLEFRRALQFRNSFPSPTPPPATQPTPEPPKPPTQKPVLTQDIWVTEANGQILTRAEPPNEHFLRPEIRACSSAYLRHYIFHDQHVPTPYLFVNHHNGHLYPNTRNVFITYSHDTFLDLAQREALSPSPFLLDGPRLNYQRLNHLHPLQRNSQ